MYRVNKFMTVTTGAALVALGSMGISQPAQAILIGDEVTFDYLFPDGDTIYETRTFTVEEGTDDVFNVFGDTLIAGGSDRDTTSIFNFDVEAESIGLDFSVADFNGFWTPASFNGWRLSDLDWQNAQGRIIGLTLDTNMRGLSLDNFAFTDNSVEVNWQGLNFNRETYVNIGLETQHVPEPASIFALLTALGFGALSKKKLSSETKQ